MTCILSDSHYKTSRTGVSPVLRGEMLGQPGRLSYRSFGALANKNRSICISIIFISKKIRHIFCAVFIK